VAAEGGWHAPFGMDEPLIYRDEVVALLFNVSEIVVRLETIQRLLEDGADREEEME
jgi:hypothetical protein